MIRDFSQSCSGSVGGSYSVRRGNVRVRPIPRNTSVLFGLQRVVVFQTVHVGKQHFSWLNGKKLRPIEIQIIVHIARVGGVRSQWKAGISRMGRP